MRVACIRQFSDRHLRQHARGSYLQFYGEKIQNVIKKIISAIFFVFVLFLILVISSLYLKGFNLFCIGLSKSFIALHQRRKMKNYLWKVFFLASASCYFIYFCCGKIFPINMKLIRISFDVVRRLPTRLRPIFVCMYVSGA